MRFTTINEQKTFIEHLKYLFTLSPSGRRKRADWNEMVAFLKQEGRWVDQTNKNHRNMIKNLKSKERIGDTADTHFPAY